MEVLQNLEWGVVYRKQAFSSIFLYCLVTTTAALFQPDHYFHYSISTTCSVTCRFQSK